MVYGEFVKQVRTDYNIIEAWAAGDPYSVVKCDFLPLTMALPAAYPNDTVKTQAVGDYLVPSWSTARSKEALRKDSTILSSIIGFSQATIDHFEEYLKLISAFVNLDALGLVMPHIISEMTLWEHFHVAGHIDQLDAILHSSEKMNSNFFSPNPKTEVLLSYSPVLHRDSLHDVNEPVFSINFNTEFHADIKTAY